MLTGDFSSALPPVGDKKSIEEQVAAAPGPAASPAPSEYVVSQPTISQPVPELNPVIELPAELPAARVPEMHTAPAVSFARPEEKPQQNELTPMGHVFHIEVAKIFPNPNQPRKNFNEEGIRELAYSIREFGFLQPLVVSKVEEESPTGVSVSYQLIAGERRYMAAKLLGLEAVPAIIRQVDLEREKLELAVIENIQRENLNPMETARAFQRLQEEFRLTQREIAAKLGKSRETVANSVRLLDLPQYIQEALEKGQLSESHGRFLLAIGDLAAQKRLFEDIVNYRLTTRDVKERVQAAKATRGTPTGSAALAGLPPELKMMQERLSAELGTPVLIQQKGAEAGKIEISFFSKEELQSILNKIGKEGEN